VPFHPDLSIWFRVNELIFNLKKGKSEVMLFGTGKFQVKLSVNGSTINTTTCYKNLGLHLKTLNSETNFKTFTRRPLEEWTPYGASVPALSIDTAQRIDQSMIMPVFMYCGYASLGWSESRKPMIHCSIESWSLEIISPKCSPQNCDLRFFDNWHLLQKRACWFVFDCLNGTTCFPF